MKEIEKKPAEGRSQKEKWRQHLESWRAAGGTQAAYCRDHGLSRNAFHYWKYRIERESLSGFVEVSHSMGQPGGVIDILVDERFRVRVPEGTDSDHLRMVLRAVLEL